MATDCEKRKNGAAKVDKQVILYHKVFKTLIITQ